MARKIKFALEMADGAKVRGSLEELREHFDLESAVRYFLSGKLIEWLDDRYYEKEAEALEAIEKDAPDLNKRLCEALGVEYDAEEDLDVTALERLNEKKSVLRQRTEDEEIIKNADKTALTQEDLADLLDMGEDVIYLCGEEFTVPARVKNKKYIGILGTPKVSINAKSQEELDAKGIVFENVVLPWVKKEESVAVESAPINAKSDWEVPFEKLHKVVMASFAKELESRKNIEGKTGTYYNQDKDKIWMVVGETSGIELDETQKEIALSVVCGGEYEIDDIVYIRVTEDLSAGWAFTKDSFCASYEEGALNIPYKFIKIEKRKLSEGGKDYYYYYVLNVDTNEEWLFYKTPATEKPSELLAATTFVILSKCYFKPISIDTTESIIKCLNTIKNLFKK